MWDDGYVLLRHIEMKQDRLRQLALERQAHVDRDPALLYDEKPVRRLRMAPTGRRGLRWWLHWLRWKQR